VRLDSIGYDVALYERHRRILSAASGINQYRVHRGYHYPRSSETGRYLLDTVSRFEDEYGDLLTEADRHLYAIAANGSLTTADQFLQFLDRHRLEYRLVEDERVRASEIELLVEVTERLLDPHRLAVACRERLERSRIQLHLGVEATESSTADFDRVVVCGYATASSFFDLNPGLGQVSQFEVCEKPVVKMPRHFGRPSIVVLDGPFMCIDPVGRSEYFVMGNVTHAIHATNVGLRPVVPDHLAPLLDTGVVPAPRASRFDSFVASGSRYIPAMAEAEHVGSMFTTRTVLPDLERTDARPTIVHAVDDRIVSVFAGKLATCVDAADRVARLLER